jgi:hypothetical protein
LLNRIRTLQIALDAENERAEKLRTEIHALEEQIESSPFTSHIKGAWNTGGPLQPVRDQLNADQQELSALVAQIPGQQAQLSDLETQASQLLSALLIELNAYRQHCGAYKDPPPWPTIIELIPLGAGPIYAGTYEGDECADLLKKVRAAQEKLYLAKQAYLKALDDSVAAQDKAKAVADSLDNDPDRIAHSPEYFQAATDAKAKHAACDQAAKAYRNAYDDFDDLRSIYEKHCGDYPFQPFQDGFEKTHGPLNPPPRPEPEPPKAPPKPKGFWGSRIPF